MFYFLFISPQDLRDPSADRRENVASWFVYEFLFILSYFL